MNLQAPHKAWQYHPRHRNLYRNDIKFPETFNDDYKHRAKAAAAATLTIEFDLTYEDIGMVQPEGGSDIGRLIGSGPGWEQGGTNRMVPSKVPMELVDKETGERYSFSSKQGLKNFKYQQYMKRYLRTIQCVKVSLVVYMLTRGTGA